VPALAGGPPLPTPPARTAAPERRAPRIGYHVFVPGRGSFATVDEAEQELLDRRWARAGSPTLGAPGTRREEDEAS